MLEQCRSEEILKQNSNQWKVSSYTRALNAVKAHDRPINSPGDLVELKGKGVGPRIAQRILAHITGQSYNPETKKIEEKNDEATDEDLQKAEDAKDAFAVSLLMTVPGIGKVKAQQLVRDGCRNIQQLSESQHYLSFSRAAQIGIKYHTLISQPVTRKQAETILGYVQEYLNSKWEVILAGSYRRGAAESSDIDLILLHPSHVHIPVPTMSTSKSKKEKAPSKLTKEVVEPLRRAGIIADSLSSGPLKWQGIVRIPGRNESGQWESITTRVEAVQSLTGPFRRADFNLVPFMARGAALLSLTGDTEFNRDLRLRAQRLGLHLNEYGLWRFKRHDGDTTLPQTREEMEEGHWELVASEAEEDIFRELNMPYVQPEKRNFAFLANEQKQSRASSWPLASLPRRGRPKKY
ncbi:hypothetical protein NM688_g1994 [Phlebia brevispora]|uniref:Uncharacterized protein n=1 Tax=Phlebia brevispora TaxID=194682 RepID=A0ACC1T9M5_9APHY|nr:hypothetical protein NM688_g1994 [Phlebia brevispora]